MKMRMESKDFRKLGVMGILEEASSLLQQKPMLFLELALGVIYPFLTFTQFLAYGYIAWVKRVTASWVVNQQLQSYDQVWNNHIIWLDSARLLGGYLLLSIVVTAFALVTMMLVIYAAAATLKGETVTLRSVMAFLPAGLKRVFLTKVVSLIFFLGVTVGYALVVCPSIICISALVPQSVLILLIVVAFIIFVIGLVHLQVAWLLWPAIAVLEENWGTECLCKSAFLVKGKGWTSFLLMAIFMSAGGLTTFNPVHGNDGLTFGLTLMLPFMSIALTLLGCLTITLLYFVCISYHEHSTSFASQMDGYLAGYTHPQEYSESENIPIKVYTDTLDPK